MAGFVIGADDGTGKNKTGSGCGSLFARLGPNEWHQSLPSQEIVGWIEIFVDGTFDTPAISLDLLRGNQIAFKFEFHQSFHFCPHHHLHFDHFQTKSICWVATTNQTARSAVRAQKYICTLSKENN